MRFLSNPSAFCHRVRWASIELLRPPCAPRSDALVLDAGIVDSIVRKCSEIQRSEACQVPAANRPYSPFSHCFHARMPISSLPFRPASIWNQDQSGDTPSAVFPFHRCADYSPKSLPYALTKPVETRPGMYCMTLTYLGPSPNATTCYNILSTVGATRLTIGVGESSHEFSFCWPFLVSYTSHALLHSPHQHGLWLWP